MKSTNNFRVIENQSDWNDLLQCLNHDWYHTYDYHKLNHLDGKPILLVMKLDDGTIAMPFVLRAIDDTSWYDLTSVYGYPGPIFSSAITGQDLNYFFSQMKGWCEENDIVSVFSRLNPVLAKGMDNSYFHKVGETVWIDLSDDESVQWSRYRKNYRNLISKLRREGFECKESTNKESVNVFQDIYRETMISLNAEEYYFFDDKYFAEIFNSRQFEAKIFNVYYSGEIVSSAVIVYCGDIVQYHLSGTRNKYKSFAPTRLLIDEVRRDAKLKGYRYFHLGGGLGSEQDSLFNFKYGFSKTTLDFTCLKYVVDENRYKELSRLDLNSQIDLDGFFPLYRK